MTYKHLIKDGETVDNLPYCWGPDSWEGIPQFDEVQVTVFSKTGDKVGVITKNQKTGEYGRYSYQPELYTRIA